MADSRVERGGDTFRHRVKVSVIERGKRVTGYEEADFNCLPLSTKEAFVQELVKRMKVLSEAFEGGIASTQALSKDSATTTTPATAEHTTSEMHAHCNFGYYSPGHQFKGRKHVVEEDSDMAVMYSCHDAGARRSIVFLWAEVSPVSSGELRLQARCASAHSHTASKSASSNASLMEGKMRALSQLGEKQSGKGYRDEQMEDCAFMMTQGRAGIDEPALKKRFSGYQQGEERQSEHNQATAQHQANPLQAGPENIDRRLERRSKILDQLKQLKELFDLGVLDEGDYQAQKKSICNDLRQV